MLVVVVHPIHVPRVLLIRVLRVLLIHVQRAHVLLNQSLVANAETLAVAKNESP
jgi:hypothetical protein